MDTTTATRDDFLSLFKTSIDAIMFEGDCLSIGDSFLPDHVIDVREYRCERNSTYWQWLIDQFEQPSFTPAKREEMWYSLARRTRT